MIARRSMWAMRRSMIDPRGSLTMRMPLSTPSLSNNTERITGWPATRVPRRPCAYSGSSMARPMYSCWSSKRTLTSWSPFGSRRHLRNSLQSSIAERGGPSVPSRPSFLPVVALLGVVAREFDPVFVWGGPFADILGQKIFPHRLDFAVRQEVVSRGRHVLAHLFARVAVAALVGVGEAVMVGHAGAGPAAFHHFGELLRRELGDAQRQCIATIALVAGGIPFVAVLAHGLALEDFLAEFDETRLFGAELRLRIGSDGHQERNKSSDCSKSCGPPNFRYDSHLDSLFNIEATHP